MRNSVFWETIYCAKNSVNTEQPEQRKRQEKKAEMQNEDGAWQMIFGVSTIPEYRQQGLTGKLINRAINDAKEQGRRDLVLTCKDKLIPYYSKFGFQDEGASESEHGGYAWHQMRLTF